VHQSAVLVVIPARIGSERLPRKPLYPLAGRPLIEWVWRRVSGFAGIDPRSTSLKTAILGGNNARLYGYSPKMMSEVETDKVAYYKGLYEKHGGDRTNLAYGYIRKG
jgi:hypothetical protein